MPRYNDVVEHNLLKFKSYNTLCTDPTTRTANCTDGELRLRGGATSREGRVEMCYERQWGTVCDSSWGTNDAKVACRQLGFSSFGNFCARIYTFQHSYDKLLVNFLL